MSFDPYHQWLGIPFQEQPPHFYRLLGIQIFEADPSVIDHAADRQMAHLRSFQQGPRGALAAQLMNAVSAARVCLLDADKKGAYDAALNANLSAVNPMVAAAAPELPPQAALEPAVPPMVVESSPIRGAAISQGPQAIRPQSARSQPVRSKPARSLAARPRQRKSPAVEIAKIVIGGVAGILVALLIGGFGLGVGPFASVDSDDAIEDSNTPETNGDQDTRNQVAANARNRNSIQTRVPTRNQPANQRFSDPANPASAIDRDTGLASGIDSDKDSSESHTASLAEHLDQRFAEVQSLLGGEFLQLQTNVPITTNARYVWSNFVPELNEFHFLKNAYQQRTTSFEITNTGMVLLAVNAQWSSGGPAEGKRETAIRKDLELDDWHEVGDLAANDTNNLGNIKPFIIFARACRKGETFSYRAEKDIAPVLILKPRSDMLVQGNDTNQSGVARPAKQEIPDEETAQASLETIREVFKQEYAAVEDLQQAPEQLSVARLKLAKALQEHADSVQDDFADRYVLLTEAYNQALAASNVARTQQLADQLKAEYEVDELELGLDMLTKLANSEQSDRVKLDLAIASMTLANELLDNERFEDALRIADLAQSLGERSARMKERAAEFGNEIRDAQQQWNAIRQAKATLNANPDDVEANLVYGTYLCLKKNDWPAGLPLLAKGSDKQLQAIASDDLNSDEDDPSENEQMIALADKWYDLAKSNESYKPFFSRAYYWYSAAIPEAKSLAKIKLEKRIEELAEYSPAKSMSQDTAADSSNGSTPIADAMKRLSRKGSSFAKIQLAVAGDFALLAPDADITSTSKISFWSTIPQELLNEQLGFLRNKGQQGTLKFEITTPGILLMTASWDNVGMPTGRTIGSGNLVPGGSWEKEVRTQQDLVTDGWIQVGKLQSTNRLTGKPEEWVLFARYCKKGEFFTYRTNYSTAPVLILK